jgi:DNA-binding transcriptional ArsR family regulator
MDDEEARAFLAERRRADDRAFMIRGLDPEVAPRLSPALNAIRDLLADGREYSFTEVVTAAAVRSDLTVKTIGNALSRLLSAGIIRREGRWGKGLRDTRRYALVSWPDEVSR